MTQTHTIKRGATFRADLLLDADDPWPVEVRAAVRQAGRTHPLTITLRPDERAITLTAETDSWDLALAQFDVWLDLSGSQVPVPWGRNVVLNIIEGATP